LENKKINLGSLKKSFLRIMIENKEIAGLRRNYSNKPLSEDNVHTHPHEQFIIWLNEALNAAIIEPNAMILATSSQNGIPGIRTLLLKGIAEDGYIFYTNYLSKKAQEIEENPNASILFLWKELERQLIVAGRIEKLPREESEEYFNTRPVESKIGAWASIQSSVIPDRKFIEEEYERYNKKFSGSEIPMPDYWGGYKLIPYKYEFWQGRESRLHDRISYIKENNSWKILRLSP
jgi:pyridoxamine 5'-phosphate oxidase